MTRILRYFPQFRALEASLIAAESARIKADDDVRLWRSRCDWAESDRDKARAELSHVLKNISNWQALMTGAPQVPFPENHTPPKPREEDFQPAQPHRPSMRDIQQQAVRKSRMEAFERQHLPQESK